MHLQAGSWGIYSPALFLHWLWAAPGELTPSTSGLTHMQLEQAEKRRVQEQSCVLSTWEPVWTKGTGAGG